MPKVSPRHKSRRRDAILAAAEEVFLGKGYQSATVDDIALKSNLSVGALYRYFSGKSDIMLTLMERRLGRTPELLQRWASQVASPWLQLSRCVDIFSLALRVRHPSTGRLLLVAWGEALQDPAVRDGLQRRYRGLTDYLHAVLQEGITSGAFRGDADPAVVASLLIYLADGATLYWATSTPGMDLDRIRATVMAMLSAYLSPDS